MGGVSEFQTWVSRGGVRRKVYRVARDYYLDGKRRQVVGQGQTYREAWERFDKGWQRYLLRSGQIPAEELATDGRRRTDGRTLTEVIDEWWVFKRTDGAQGQTLARYESSLRLHIKPALGNRLVGDITENDIRVFLHDTLPAKTKTKKDGTTSRLLGGSPIRKIALLLNEVFEYARRKRYVTENPCEWVKKPAYRPVANERVSEMTSLPGDLLYWLGDTPEAGYWVLAFLGLRQAERLGLGWSSFENLEDEEETCYLTIDRQLSYRPDVPGPDGKGTVTVKRQVKTSAGERKFALSADVRKAILRWKAAQDEWKRNYGSAWPRYEQAEMNDLVYTRPDGRPILPQTDLKDWNLMFRRVNRDRAADGLPPLTRVRPHLMRHIAATILAEKQVPPRHAMKILGHSREAMTAYYTHLSARETAESITSLSESIFVGPLLAPLTAWETTEAEMADWDDSEWETIGLTDDELVEDAEGATAN